MNTNYLFIDVIKALGRIIYHSCRIAFHGAHALNDTINLTMKEKRANLK